jgi:hypothetical protein
MPGKGKPPKLQERLKKRAESQPSGAPENDGGRSFSTRERLFDCTRDVQKRAIFREKDAYWVVSGLRSENAVLGNSSSKNLSILYERL